MHLSLLIAESFPSISFILPEHSNEKVPVSNLISFSLSLPEEQLYFKTSNYEVVLQKVVSSSYIPLSFIICLSYLRNIFISLKNCGSEMQSLPVLSVALGRVYKYKCLCD